MSAALAIAATSEVLRFLVNDALTRAAADLQFVAPQVSTGAPPRPNPADGADAPAVNLFLHHTSPNPAGRNIMGPARDAQGRRLNNAPLILDLHYLLSAHGPETLREIGLGSAMHALHQAGIVPRELIRRVLKALETNPDASKQAVARSRLADQIESLTISAQSLDLDAITKIWTATQSPYRPSAGILVTTVFLEDVRPSRAPLPVVSPALTPVPVRELKIDAVEGDKAGVAWPITPEADLLIAGSGFADGDLSVLLGGVPLAIDLADSGPTRLRLKFTPVALADLLAGPQLLRLALSTMIGGRSMQLQTAAVAITLHPTVSLSANPNVPTTPTDPARVTGALDVTVAPPVARSQNVVLMLTPLTGGADQSIPWRTPVPVDPPVDSFTALTFQLTKILKGTYLARLSIDGTWSQPMPNGSGQFQPQVTL
jgi:hypothetical protein